MSTEPQRCPNTLIAECGSLIVEVEGLEFDQWGQHLPEEILLRIFEEAVLGVDNDPSSAVVLLCRLSQVCTLWHDVSTHQSLWQRVDLSHGWVRRSLPGLQSLCEHRLSVTRQLDLTAWYKLQDEDIKILSGCSSLRWLSLSHCDSLTGLALHLIADHLPHVTHLDLDYLSPSVTIKQHLLYLVSKFGNRLQRLNLSGNFLCSGFSVVLAELARKCAGLEELLLCDEQSRCQDISLDIEKLQIGCPRLRVLALTRTPVHVPRLDARIEVMSPGFQHLEEFRCSQGMEQDGLFRVLRTSSGLKSLSLQEARVHTLSRLPVTALQRIQLPQDLPQELFRGIAKWESSLESVDLSWSVVRGSDLNSILCEMLDCSQPVFQRLRSLNLCGTSVSFNGVRSVLENCHGLRSLNLSCCSHLPTGWMGLYQGQGLASFRCTVLEGDAAGNGMLSKMKHRQLQKYMA